MKKILLTLAILSSSACFANSNLLEMGYKSYGNPSIMSWGEDAKAKVGKYCSIASGVGIMLGGEHRVDWVTTFPFSALYPEARHIKGHPKTKGDVIIGNDVWIGREALILSGVTIGNGAVIGARALVTKDVPAYAIVGGNPAKIIRYRFDPTTISQLQKIAWWDWSDREISHALPYLLSPDMEKFINYCKAHRKL